jgi:hypothetical protein
LLHGGGEKAAVDFTDTALGDDGAQGMDTSGVPFRARRARIVDPMIATISIAGDVVVFKRDTPTRRF